MEEQDATRSTVTTLCGIGRALSFSPPLFQEYFEANLRKVRAVIRLVSFSPTGIYPIEDRSSKDGRQSRADVVKRFPPESRFERSHCRRGTPLRPHRRLAYEYLFPRGRDEVVNQMGCVIYAIVTRDNRRCALRHVIASRSGNEGE